MAIDIYHSRRAKFNRCEFYTRNEDEDIEKLVMKKYPDGIFYAVEITPLRNDKNEIGGVLRFDNNQITLKTGDDVNKLKADDIVRYRNNIWRVVDKQFDFDIKENEFSSDSHGETVILLRR